MEMVKQYGPLVGRILLGLIFVIAGIGKLTGFEGTVGYMQAHSVPMAQILAVASTIIELGGGIMLIIGWKAHIGAAALFLYVLILSPIFHGFWAVPAEQQQLQMYMFLKNLAIMGGMLYIMAYGPGPMAAEKNS
ncbi:MAG: DoxX family protein [Burkholderiales bacterium]